MHSVLLLHCSPVTWLSFLSTHGFAYKEAMIQGDAVTCPGSYQQSAITLELARSDELPPVTVTER